MDKTQASKTAVSAKKKKTSVIRSTVSIKCAKKPKKKTQKSAERKDEMAHVRNFKSLQITAPKVADKPTVKSPFVKINDDGTSEVVNSVKELKLDVTTSQESDFKQPGMFSSVFHPKFKDDVIDPTWICVFCKLGPPKRCDLGDLFGPDYTDVNQQGTAAKIARKLTMRLRSDARSQSSTSAAAKDNKASFDQCGMSMTADGKSFEFWYHEDCIVWCNGVHMGAGNAIVGVENAVWSHLENRCSICSKFGAMLSCLDWKCKIKAHCPCAVDAGWRLTDEFQSFCEKH